MSYLDHKLRRKVGICPICFGELRKIDGKYRCLKCGTIWTPQEVI